ncbi:MAG: hypothetical protein K1X67_18880, partial [Fimbriimonadaceae bacterium]|nr:hypothetical protein [Fimbriimonadaceae bacterium]
MDHAFATPPLRLAANVTNSHHWGGKNHPEWIDLVIHIGQEGRGCNVFFTLGGQRLDLSSLSKAKSNI